MMITTGCHSKVDLYARIGDIEVLRGGPNLTDLHFINQYYLAENLGIPAMTDWIPGKISPGFISDWNFDGSTKLQLTIRPRLRWSDGSKIKNEEILNHFKKLGEVPRLHLPSFKELKLAELNGNIVTLIFRKPVMHILEELCRADGVLHSGTWGKTSGPYYILSENSSEILLVRNTYFPPELLNGVSSPEKIHIIFPPLEHVSNQFRDKKLDFALSSGPSIFPPHAQWAEAGAIPYTGAMNVVHYFRFGQKVPKNLRIALAKAVKVAKANVLSTEYFQSYDQIIPPGYPSYIDQFTASNNRTQSGDSQSISCEKSSTEHTLVIWEAFDTVPTRNGKKFSEILRDALESQNCRISIKTIGRMELATAMREPKYSIIMDGFLGNARDPDGSWSYLSSATPPIVTSKTVLEALEAARHEQVSAQKREVLYQNVHKLALEQLDIIPVFLSANAIYHDARLDVSRINPLDLRVRFWMTEWK